VLKLRKLFRPVASSLRVHQLCQEELLQLGPFPDDVGAAGEARTEVGNVALGADANFVPGHALAVVDGLDDDVGVLAATFIKLFSSPLTL